MGFVMIVAFFSVTLTPGSQITAATSQSVHFKTREMCERSANDLINSPRPDKMRIVVYCVEHD